MKSDCPVIPYRRMRRCVSGRSGRLCCVSLISVTVLSATVAAIVLAYVAGFAQEATVRIHWSTSMAAEIPWYVTEVPTVFVSLSLPNHLIDVPMVKTVIHAHAPSREAIRAAVEKIQGKSPFQGTFNENVFCDSFDTRL